MTAIPDVASEQPGERGILYDEWDAKARAYRRDHCTVYPGHCPAGDPAFAPPRIARNRCALVKAAGAELAGAFALSLMISPGC